MLLIKATKTSHTVLDLVVILRSTKPIRILLNGILTGRIVVVFSFLPAITVDNYAFLVVTYT